MVKKLLCQFDYIWQAELFAQDLQSAGIDFELFPESKHYAQIVTGNAFSRTNIFVDESKYAEALVICEKFKSTPVVEDPSEKIVTQNYFKRVIVFSTLGMIWIPIILNWYATKNFLLLKKQGTSRGKLVFSFVILALGWIVAMGLVVFFIRTYTQAYGY